VLTLLLVCIRCFADAYDMPNLQDNAMRLFMRYLEEETIAVSTVQFVADIARDTSQLWAAVMQEVASIVYRHGYNSEEVNALGAIPGVMEGMVNCSVQHVADRYDDELDVHSAWTMAEDEFMVKKRSRRR
jgi:hypothetical protein